MISSGKIIMQRLVKFWTLSRKLSGAQQPPSCEDFLNRTIYLMSSVTRREHTSKHGYIAAQWCMVCWRKLQIFQLSSQNCKHEYDNLFQDFISYTSPLTQSLPSPVFLAKSTVYWTADRADFEAAINTGEPNKPAKQQKHQDVQV